MMDTKAATIKYEKRTFIYTGLNFWNTLPLDIRKENNFEKFRQKVEILLFKGTVNFT